MAGIAEAKLAEMAAKMAAGTANSRAGIAEAKPAKMAAEMATVNFNRMAGKFSGRDAFSAVRRALPVFPLRGGLLMCPLLQA